MYLLLIYLLIPIVPLIIMPRYIKTGSMSPYRTVMQAVLFTTASAAVVFMAASIGGPGLFAQLQEMSETLSKELASNPMIIDAFKQMSADQDSISSIIEEIYSQAFAVVPATVMAMSAVAAYIEYIIMSKIMGRRRAVKKMPAFREFSFPHSAFMGIMAMYFITWILTQTGVFSDNMMYANINFLFDFVFSIQGISLVLMFCHAKKIPKALGAAAAVVLWVTFLGKTVLVMMGMFDLIFNFKARLLSSTGRSR